jgi:hypothetical protein
MMSGSVVVLWLITIVGSVLITWLLPVDIGAGTAVGIAWSLVAYLVLSPLIGLKGWMALVMSALDAIGFAAVVTWVLRRIK